ncbi:MAG: hypothetical protein LBB86_10345, partial [Oscillospiraceae bacterium]|nr:hypothetical protein [Oscillospiraceae bacterium]
MSMSRLSSKPVGVVIGVDGGGTRSVAAAFDETGRFLARETLEESLNSNSVGLDSARKTLSILVRRLLARAGVEDYRILAIGSSALNRDGNATELEWLCGGEFSAEKCILFSDAKAALVGASRGRAG